MTSVKPSENGDKKTNLFLISVFKLCIIIKGKGVIVMQKVAVEMNKSVSQCDFFIVDFCCLHVTI